MNLASYRVPLDIHTALSQAVIPFKQYDSGRRIEFCLREDGRNYDIDEHTFAVLRAKKADGTVLYNTCPKIDNMFIYDLTNQTTSALGVIDCELTVYGGDQRQITSPRFTFIVEANMYDDDIVESEDEFTALADAIVSANNLDANVERTANGAKITITKKDLTQVTAEVFDASIEQIKSVIDEWIPAHPEYVTTVMDGSITMQKLHPSVVNEINNGLEIVDGLLCCVYENLIKFNY